MSDELRRKRAKEKLERIKAPVELVLLDDIARAIKETNRRLAAQVPEGIKDETNVSVAGINAVAMQPTHSRPPYFRATVFNDGPDPAYVMLNDITPVSMRQAPINAGDQLNIDTTEAKIHALFFACPNPNNNAVLRVQLLK